VVVAARRKGELSRPCRPALVAELEGQLTLEDVEGLVEVVVVQRRAAPVAGTRLSMTATWSLVCSARSSTVGENVVMGAFRSRTDVVPGSSLDIEA
jgi:hypothetical protein